MAILGTRLNSGTVHKIGRTTGWSSGSLYDTCFDFKALDGKGGNVYIICGTIANYKSDQGDSGAPVFQRNSNDAEVTVVGLHFGGITWSDGTKRGVYMPLVGIHSDIGLWHPVSFLYDFQWTYL